MSKFAFLYERYECDSLRKEKKLTQKLAKINTTQGTVGKSVIFLIIVKVTILQILS
jgi:hypothetical protein